ncbi:excisionase family DNA binding protein [Prosthecobacter fusiformis]|uniref:Excisionase family DNA binding protein n=2 Tax=Prosthecobacter fusiformis TaxID=48464 RepID=A0A4R7RN77_9BACT|nr:excisionase family DNA binding protein [Prosthecobacter fusiformis]
MPTTDHPIVPTQSDVLLAQKSYRILGKLSEGRDAPMGIKIGGQEVEIPGVLCGILFDALAKVAEGKGVALKSIEEEVSPQEAAELLNVSRPFAARLFDEGAFPSRKVGSHRRALASEVIAYKEREKQARLKALEELAAYDQSLNLGIQ